MTLFAIAMAYLEATVVVYLRMLYYPDGFDFPLMPTPPMVMFIELGREAATIIMLVAVGIIAGRSKIERFAYLIFAFGIWDIMYYVWLKVQIGWPDSLLTWDILFLIPTIWAGPVIAPVLVSLTMIWAALWIIRKQDAGITPHFARWAWWVEIFAGLIIIISFIWDAKNVAAGGYPNAFRWEIFLIGLLLGINVFIREIRKPANRLQGHGA
ncbi:MAG: hypothetical protein ABIE92_09740 [bacterium]